MKTKKLKVYEISDQVSATYDSVGTYKVGVINEITYGELSEILGQPTFSTTSHDEKVQKEWVVDFDGEIYTIYDWKTYDERYTMEELTNWNVGGKTSALDFIEYIEIKQYKS
ncbi:MAG: hypothetical protein QNK68_06215 [Flavobacteriales bacterium]